MLHRSHLGGTGARSRTERNREIAKREATLPFSRLDVTNGFLYFDPERLVQSEDRSARQIADPRLHGAGLCLRKFARAPGDFLERTALPQEEIISLLATGTTRQELTGNSNVLAGRAAMLLVQQLYRKFSRKGSPRRAAPFSIVCR